MSTNDYHFVTRWRFHGVEAQEIADILDDVGSLARWWPAVYLEVRELKPGEPATRLGREVELFTKGWLPYTLRWTFRVTGRTPNSVTLESIGDFVGRGVWTVQQDGRAVNVSYDWHIRADKLLLRAMSFALKPVFAANHQWAMARGEESMRLELRRRRARTDDERARVPPPPGPTFTTWVDVVRVFSR